MCFLKPSVCSHSGGSGVVLDFDLFIYLFNLTQIWTRDVWSVLIISRLCLDLVNCLCTEAINV